MSFKLSNLAKVEKSIVVRENDKDVREIDIYLAEVLRLIDPFDFTPVVHFAQRIDITNAWTSAEERDMGAQDWSQPKSKKEPQISQRRDYFYKFLPSILAICKTCRLKHADQRKRAMDNVCIS